MKLKPVSQIKLELGINEGGRVQKFIVNACYNRMDKYVPLRDTGLLRTNVHFTSNSITYKVPYANYQYHGIREDGTHEVHNWTTAGTGPYWDKAMMSAEKQQLISEIQEYINNGRRN